MFELLILGSSTWLGYSADRFCEPARQLPGTHLKYLIGYQKPVQFFILWSTILLFSVTLSLQILPSTTLLFGAVLLVVVVLNFFLRLLEQKNHSELFPKNIRTSAILAWGCVFWIIPEKTSGDLIVAWVFLFFLFYLNCYSLQRGEKSFRLVYFDLGKIPFLGGKPKARIVNPLLVTIPMICAIHWSSKLLFASTVSVVVFLFFLEKRKIADEYFQVFLDGYYWVLPLLLTVIVFW